MNRHQRLATFVVGAVMLAVPARSQDPAASAARYIDERGGLGLEAAVSRALEREPSLRAVRADIEVARGTRQQAGQWPNPTLTFERRDEPGGTDNQTTVGVAWPLDLFRRPARVQTAEREVQATELAVADRERVLIADVRTQYGTAVAAVRDLGVAADVAAAAQRQLDVVRARVEAGGTPPLERDLLEVERAPVRDRAPRRGGSRRRRHGAAQATPRDVSRGTAAGWVRRSRRWSRVTPQNGRPRRRTRWPPGRTCVRPTRA